nr:MAG TPA: hypothetical protein [Siphoviridae sp. ctTlV16]
MNNMLVEVLRMRAQGMTPMAARQTLLQRFPQTQRLAAFTGARNAQELDMAAQNTARSMGFDPQTMLSNAQRMMR